jgi:Tfp pilus assembly protein PilV
MSRSKQSAAGGFALYEVLIGVTIFVVGVLALGRAVENCMNASVLSAQDDRVRLILANRMAEVQATPGQPDPEASDEVDSGYGIVKLTQKTAPAGLKSKEEIELNGISLVKLTAEWTRNGHEQSRSIEFYVYRSG